MKYIVASLPVIASAVQAAEIVGTVWLEASDVAALAASQSQASHSGPYTLFQATQTQTWATEPTPEPVT